MQKQVLNSLNRQLVDDVEQIQNVHVHVLYMKIFTPGERAEASLANELGDVHVP